MEKKEHNQARERRKFACRVWLLSTQLHLLTRKDFPPRGTLSFFLVLLVL